MCLLAMMSFESVGYFSKSMGLKIVFWITMCFILEIFSYFMLIYIVSFRIKKIWYT